MRLLLRTYESRCEFHCCCCFCLSVFIFALLCFNFIPYHQQRWQRRIIQNVRLIFLVAKSYFDARIHYLFTMYSADQLHNVQIIMICFALISKWAWKGIENSILGAWCVGHVFLFSNLFFLISDFLGSLECPLTHTCDATTQSERLEFEFFPNKLHIVCFDQINWKEIV